MRNFPLYELTLTTRRLTLRLPTLVELDELADLTRGGVFSAGPTPFYSDWTNAGADQVARGVILHHWRKLSAWSPDNWELPLCVFRDGEVVGSQVVKGTGFAVTREVRTGSWLGLPHQRQGIGTEMRAAVLAFAFEYLGAVTARSGAFTDNHASAAVSAKLGYRDDGVRRQVVDGALRECQFYRLNLDAFASPVDLTVDRLEACRHLFGADPGEAT